MNRSLQWRRFTFFDKDAVCENIETALGARPTCSSAESGMLLFGDASGHISIADRNFAFDRKCKAFRGQVHGVHYLFDGTNHRRQFILAIGDDSRNDGESGPTQSQFVIKLFNLNDLTRPIHAFHANAGVAQDATITSFACLPDGSQVAVGYSNSTILLFSAQLLSVDTLPIKTLSPSTLSQPRASNNSTSSSVPPQRAYMNAPVSGLHFCELASTPSTSAPSTSAPSTSNSTPPNIRKIRLLATYNTAASTAHPSSPSLHSEGGVVCYDTTPLPGTPSTSTPYTRKSPLVLDEQGCMAGCSSMMAETKELVVGRDDGVFSYSVDDRGGAAGFDGTKQCVVSIGRYILVAVQDERTGRTTITIYDLRNKFISCSAPLPAGERVESALVDGGICYIITTAHTLLRFKEKSTLLKLETLTRKSLFTLAITLAAEEQCDAGDIMRLYKLHGDALYDKGEFEEAVEQYRHTIGYLQPSYVVRRFLSPQRASCLTLYLEALLERRGGTGEHALLLLMCYSKARSEDKITALIDRLSPIEPNTKIVLPAIVTNRVRTLSHITPSSILGGPASGVRASSKMTDTGATTASSTASSSCSSLPSLYHVDLDVARAVGILIEGGWKDAAARLATKCGRHDLHLLLLLHAPLTSSSTAALSITSAEASNALPVLAQLALTAPHALPPLLTTHTAALLAIIPDTYTELLIQIFTTSIGTSTSTSTSTGTTSRGNSHTGLGLNPSLLGCLESLLPSFAGKDLYLLKFLEGIYQNGRGGTGMGGASMSPRVLETLLELCLAQHEKSPSRELERRLISLVDSLDTESDPSQILLLCHTYGMQSGVQHLLGKAFRCKGVEGVSGSAHDTAGTYTGSSSFNNSLLLVRMYIEQGDTVGLLKLLRREGAASPDLYEDVLAYFVQRATDGDKGNDEDERWADVSEAVTLSLSREVVSTPRILSILSASPVLPLHVALRFVQNTVSALEAEVNSLQDNVKSSVKTIQDVVVEQEEQRVVLNKALFAVRGDTKGKGKASYTGTAYKGFNKSAAANPFDPADSDDDDEDTIILMQQLAQVESRERDQVRQKWDAIKAAQARRAGDHEAFFSELEASTDGFATVAAAFGKAAII